MKKYFILAGIYEIIFLLNIACFPLTMGEAMTIDKSKEIVKLPAPRFDGNIPVETALLKRRSVRSYAAEALTLAEVSQLLWSAQGITDSILRNIRKVCYTFDPFFFHFFKRRITQDTKPIHHLIF